jgi:hypothetical protein
MKTFELPNELWNAIFSLLPFASYFPVMATCKRFNYLGRISFDPSQRDNWAIRNASQRGFDFFCERNLTITVLPSL